MQVSGSTADSRRAVRQLQIIARTSVCGLLALYASSLACASESAASLSTTSLSTTSLSTASPSTTAPSDAESARGRRKNVRRCRLGGPNRNVPAEGGCGTPARSPRSRHIPTETDCSFSRTRPAPEYAPADILEVPVVVHIIEHPDGRGAIPNSRVHSQIDVLNQDFQALRNSPGRHGTNTAISFRLASEAPDGTPTSGITRTVDRRGYNDRGRYYEDIGWDPARYLNIYTNSAGGLWGYGYMPQDGNHGEPWDGIVVHHDAFGRNAPGLPDDHGRTTTHEVGHYLGLLHTFDGRCPDETPPGCYESGDLICDTLPERAARWGCPSAPESCGSPDPSTNYMDYSDGRCMEEFTREQARRMRCTLMSYRSGLAATVGTIPTTTTTTTTSTSTTTLALPLNSYACRRARAQLSWLGAVDDGQENSEGRVRNTLQFCTAVQPVGATMHSPAAPLLRGRLRQDHSPYTLTMEDRLGRFRYRSRSTMSVLAPSATAAPGEPPPVAPAGDDPAVFRCVKVRAEANAPRIARGTTVELAGALSGIPVDVVRTTEVCLPASVVGSAADHPAAHLVCYRGRFRNADTTAATLQVAATALGTAELNPTRANTLCLPARRHAQD